MKHILIFFIKGYSWLVSPLFAQSCRFHPSCSAYAMQAVEKHGVLKGFWLAVKRIGRCHPWYKGDLIDPVPPACSEGHCKTRR